MGSKPKIAIIPGLLAILILISSEVAARDLREVEVVKETNQVGDAKNVGIGVYFDSGPGTVGPYFGGFDGYNPGDGGFFGNGPYIFNPGPGGGLIPGGGLTPGRPGGGLIPGGGFGVGFSGGIPGRG